MYSVFENQGKLNLTQQDYSPDQAQIFILGVKF